MPAFLRNNLECWQGGKFGFFDNVEKNWLDGLWRFQIGKRLLLNSFEGHSTLFYLDPNEKKILTVIFLPLLFGMNFDL